MIDNAELNRQLVELMLKLKQGDAEHIEYGDPANPGGYWSYVRVSYLMTAGGKQFAIKILNHMGIEGSGQYFHEAMDAAVAAMRTVTQYHERTVPMRLRLKRIDTSPKLEWFAMVRASARALDFPEPEDFLKDVETITLALEHERGIVPEET